MVNCGIDALNGMMDLKSVSMYTLMQIAKENGTHLYFCRVEQEDLPLVKRPAIFHSEDHFTLVEENKALPSIKFSGWVLTPRQIGRPLSHSLAKEITGSKKGGDILGPIVTGVASIVNPFLGAAVGMGFAAHKATGGSGVTNTPKGELWRIPIGGALGYLGGAQNQMFGGISNSALAGGLAAGAELPGAIKTGNYGAVLGAGAGAALGQKITSSAAYGFNQPATSLAQQIGHAGQSVMSGGQAAPSTLSAKGVSSSGFGSNVAPYNAPNVSGTKMIAGQTPMAEFGRATMTNLMQPTGDQNVQKASGGGLLGGLFGDNSGGFLQKAAGALASGIVKPPSLNYDSTGALDKASQYLEGKTLPKSTNDQLNRWISMPINDIKNEMITPAATNRAMLELDKKYQESLTDVQRRAAQGGQSVDTSSDARKAYDEVNRQWAEAKAGLQGELEQKATEEAISVKKWSLEQSIQQGQFDVKSAMELAALTNRDQELNYAIQSQNYEQFQQIVADLLGGGYEQQKEQSSLSAQMAGGK